MMQSWQSHTFPLSHHASEDALSKVLPKLGYMDLTGCVSNKSAAMQAHGGYCDIFVGSVASEHVRHRCTIPTGVGEIKVAIKRLRVRLGKDRKLARSLAREMGIWSRLTHPNILALLGYLLENEYPSLISEWIENGTVRDFVKKNPECDIVYLALGVAKGLNFIHDQNVVHSDMKADNVLINQSGEPLICDFGISRMLSSSQTFFVSTTHDGAVKGSARWMAIELHIPGEDVDPKHSKETDVWAYGMTLHEMISKEVPYSHIRLDLHVLLAVMKGELPYQQTLVDPSSPLSQLGRICADCWKRNPNDRLTMAQITTRLSFLEWKPPQIQYQGAVTSYKTEPTNYERSSVDEQDRRRPDGMSFPLLARPLSSQVPQDADQQRGPSQPSAGSNQRSRPHEDLLTQIHVHREVTSTHPHRRPYPKVLLNSELKKPMRQAYPHLLPMHTPPLPWNLMKTQQQQVVPQPRLLATSTSGLELAPSPARAAFSPTESSLKRRHERGNRVRSDTALLPLDVLGAQPPSRKVEEGLKAPEQSAHARPGSAQKLRVRRSTFIPEWAVPPRVLLVGDDAMSRKLSSKLLQVFGCTIDVAIDEVTAVNKMKLEKYDLVLMDIVVPKLYGVSVTSLIRKFDNITPIISMMSSSKPTWNEILTYYTHGVNDRLFKPFTKDDLLSMLEKHLMHLKPTQQLAKVPQSVGIPPLSDSQFDQTQLTITAANPPPPDEDGGKIIPLSGVGLSDEEYAAILQGIVNGETFQGLNPNFNLVEKRTLDDLLDGHDGKRGRFEIIE